MINKYNKFLLILLFLLSITIPVSFASDNITCEAVNDIDTLKAAESDNVNISGVRDNNVISANEVYFDASASSDGTGTQSNPYKTLSSSKLGEVNYFAAGTYTLTSGISSFYSYSAKSFIGEDMNSTIIRFTGSDDFISTGYDLTFSKISLYGANIISTGGSVTATDTVFDGGSAKADEYGNSYGGAIKQSLSSTGFDWGSIFGGGSSSSGMNFNNCIFRNNYAAYGGAIYSEKGSVTIINSRFEKNHADNGGGAVAALNGAVLTITDCEFIDDFSSYDGGGAVYLFNVSGTTIENTQFSNCHAGLGGSVASLLSSVNIIDCAFENSTASWEGGALFAMYGQLNVKSSDFYDNSAYYGGAICADNLTSFTVEGGIFKNNHANASAGAIFAFTNSVNKITGQTYISNSAGTYDDLYQTDTIDLILGSDDYEMIQYKSVDITSLPSKYDLRTTGEVTPVKDQGESGSCWAFATIATLESAILKATGKQIILSEGNLKNLANIYSDIGWRYETNGGGMYPFVFGYLTSWAGPVLASLDPTDDWDIIAPVINSAVHVQNILFLQRTSFTDNSAIKKAIMTFGAVCSEIYWSNSYLSGNNYYYSGSESRNHAVSVVGWDDTKTISGAPGAGAWIIKNSYGSSHGDGGYYYVSYYDKSLFRVYDESYNSFAVIFNDTVRFNKNYQYDAAFTDYFMTAGMNKEIWYKNTFTSTGNDILSAFSTYFRKVTTWQAEIYVNDELKLTQNGQANPGYYTINLNEAVPLRIGDNFTVSLKIQCSSSADIPISEYGQPYTLVKEYFKPGVSFFSTDGVTWTDFYGYESTFGSGESGHNYFNQVACIKAFTTEGPVEVLNTTVEIINVNSTGVSVKVLDQYGGKINTGTVEFIIDNVKYSEMVSNSQATHAVYLKAGSHTVEVTYLENGYYHMSSASKNVVLDKETPLIGIDADNINYGDVLTVKVTVTNGNMDEVNIPMTVNVNGVDYTSSQFTVSNLIPGDYSIKVTTQQTGEFKSAVFTKTVTVFKLPSNLNLVVNDTMVDEDIIVSAELSGSLTGIVNVNINSKSYQINVNNGKGMLKISNTLSPGIYTVYGEYDGNDYYNKSSLSLSFNVVKITPVLVIYDSDIVEGETAEIKIYSANNITGNVTLNINSKTYTSDFTDNTAIFNVFNLTVGKYDYNIVYSGNAKYDSVSLIDSFEVLEKAKENLTIDVSQNIIENSVSITVSMPEDITGNINLVFNQNNIGNTPVNGKTTFRLNDLTEGNYNYIISYSGDDKYYSAIYQGSFTITGTVESTITAENMVRSYLSGCDFKASFTDKYGNALVNEEVIFIINGNEYSVYTNQYGIAVLNNHFNPGSFSVTVVNQNTGENMTLTMKIVSRITGNRNIVMDYNDGTVFKVRVFGDNGSPVGYGETVKFRLNGAVYSVKTNSKGYASLKITNSPKTYTITTEYRGVKVSNRIVVKQILKSKNVAFKKSKKVKKFSATLKTSKGKIIKGKKITFKIKGKSYSAKTNKKGVATVKIAKNIKVGKYKVIISYLKTSISKTLKINKG